MCCISWGRKGGPHVAWAVPEVQRPFSSCRGPDLARGFLVFPGPLASVRRQVYLQVAHLFKPRWRPESWSRA